jgi:hypothetical protein
MRPARSLAVAGSLAFAAAPASAQQAAPPPSDEVQVTPAPPPETVVPAPAPPPLARTPPSEAEAAKKQSDEEKAKNIGPSGWIPDEGFILGSGDGLHKLRIGLQSAYKFEPRYQDGKWRDRRAFFVLRPILAGNFLKKWIRFWTSLELNSNPPFLLDSYVELNPINEFGIRLGQQYTLLSRHEQFGPQQILFPEWAPVAEYFWTGRDKGATAWGIVADGVFEYYAGIYGGSPLRQFVSIVGNYVVEARVVLSPMGAPAGNEFAYINADPLPLRLSFSLQGVYGKLQLAEENFNPSSFRFDVTPTGVRSKKALGSADIWLQGPMFIFLTEGYVQRTDPDIAMAGTSDRYTSWGIWGQVGVLLLPRTLDAGVRFNWLDPSTDLKNDTFWSGEAQVAWYVSHSQHLVVKGRFGFGEQKSPGKDALGPVPLFTSVGKFYIATLQLNLAF